MLDVIDQCMDGYVSIALTGSLDLTAAQTNYTAADNTKYRWLYFTGSLSSAATITFPAVSGWYLVTNASGQPLTLLCSGGTGVTLPTGRATLVFGDGTDIRSGMPTYQPTPVSAPTNANDLITYSQVQTLIANAALPATSGAIRNSASDTTSGYLSNKLTVTGQGMLAVSMATQNPSASETSLISHYITGGSKLTNTTTFTRGSWNRVSTSSTAWTGAFPSAGLADGDIVVIQDVGGNMETNNLTVSAGANNIQLSGQAAASALTVNSNFCLIVLIWDAASSTWVGTVYG